MGPPTSVSDNDVAVNRANFFGLFAALAKIRKNPLGRKVSRYATSKSVDISAYESTFRPNHLR